MKKQTCTSTSPSSFRTFDEWQRTTFPRSVAIQERKRQKNPNADAKKAGAQLADEVIEAVLHGN